MLPSRVYENRHPFPGLLVNYEDGTDKDERDPAWLSQMFESGFIRLIKLTSHDQISQMPQIIQKAVKKINSPFFSIRCWSTLPDWDREKWMEVHPSKHLVLINGFTYQVYIYIYIYIFIESLLDGCKIVWGLCLF